MARLASIKFSDAAAGNCLQVLGQYRSNASANQAAHNLLSLTNLDGDDDSNSQVTQQNIGNGFAMQQLNELRSANALHSCQIQQQMAATKFERDRQAEETAFERDMAAQPSTHLGSQSTLNALQHGWDFQAGEGQ